MAHAVQHGFQQPFQLFQNGRAAHAGDGDLVFQHEFVQSEPADAQNFFEIAHGAVRMDRESAFRFAPAFPLDEASAHGIIFFFQQGFAPAVVQGQNQGVAVGAVVLDAVVDDVVQARAHRVAAQGLSVVRVAIGRQIFQQAGRTL